MRRSLSACLALSLQGPLALGVPSQVVELAKRRLSESFDRNHGVALSFDTLACTRQSTYELRVHGLHISNDGEILDSDFDVSFQDLLEGKRLYPPLRNPVAITESPADDSASGNGGSRGWVIGLGVALVGGIVWAAFHQSSGHRPPGNATQAKSAR